MAKSFPTKKQIKSMGKDELKALAAEYEIDVDGLSLADMKIEIIEAGEDENLFNKEKK